MSNKFVTIMQAVGRDIKKAWVEVVAYLPAAEKLAELLFPGKATTNVVNAVDLVRQAVVSVEQKFVAAGEPSGSGKEKSAQVLAMVGPAVTSLLAAEGIQLDQTHIQSIINAVVAVLNVQGASVPATN